MSGKNKIPLKIKINTLCGVKMKITLGDVVDCVCEITKETNPNQYCVYCPAQFFCGKLGCIKKAVYDDETELKLFAAFRSLPKNVDCSKGRVKIIERSGKRYLQ